MIGDSARATFLAAVFALGYFVFGVLTAGDPQHRVTLQLNEDGTTWPWHSSIQRSSAIWINSPANGELTYPTMIEALEPVNTTELDVVATAVGPEVARKAAETSAAEFLSHDFSLQLEPFQTHRNAIQTVVDQLRSEIDEQERLGTIASNGAEIAASSARLEGTAAILGGLEGDLEQAETALASVRPRYELVESGPVSPWQERLPETAKLFGGVLLLGFVVLQMRSARFETSRDAD